MTFGDFSTAALGVGLLLQLLVLIMSTRKGDRVRQRLSAVAALSLGLWFLGRIVVNRNPFLGNFLTLIGALLVIYWGLVLVPRSEAAKRDSNSKDDQAYDPQQ